MLKEEDELNALDIRDDMNDDDDEDYDLNEEDDDEDEPYFGN